MQKEETILVSKISRWVAFGVVKKKRMIALLIIVIVLYILRGQRFDFVELVGLDAFEVPGIVFYLALGLYVFIILYAFLKLKRSRIVITNHRAMQQARGVKKPRYLKYIPLTQVASVTLTVSFFGRLFGYGRVIVGSAGVEKLDFNGLAKARKVCDTLHEQIQLLANQ